MTDEIVEDAIQTPYGEDLIPITKLEWRPLRDRIAVGHGPRDDEEVVEFQLRAFCPARLVPVVRSVFWDLYDAIQRETRLAYLPDEIRLEVLDKRPTIPGQRSLGGKLVEEVEIWKEVLPR